LSFLPCVAVFFLSKKKSAKTKSQGQARSFPQGIDLWKVVQGKKLWWIGGKGGQKNEERERSGVRENKRQGKKNATRGRVSCLSLFFTPSEKKALTPKDRPRIFIKEDAQGEWGEHERNLRPAQKFKMKNVDDENSVFWVLMVCFF